MAKWAVLLCSPNRQLMRDAMDMGAVLLCSACAARAGFFLLLLGPEFMETKDGGRGNAPLSSPIDSLAARLDQAAGRAGAIVAPSLIIASIFFRETSSTMQTGVEMGQHRQRFTGVTCFRLYNNIVVKQHFVHNKIKTIIALIFFI